MTTLTPLICWTKLPRMKVSERDLDPRLRTIALSAYLMSNNRRQNNGCPTRINQRKMKTISRCHLYKIIFAALVCLSLNACHSQKDWSSGKDEWYLGKSMPLGKSK